MALQIVKWLHGVQNPGLTDNQNDLVLSYFADASDKIWIGVLFVTGYFFKNWMKGECWWKFGHLHICARKKEQPHRIRCWASGKVTVLMMTCESWDVTRRKWTLIWMTWRAEYMRLAMVWWIQSEQIHDPLVCNSHIKNSCIRSLPTFFDASAACSDTVHFFASNLVAVVFPFFPAGLWNVRQGQVLNELGKVLAGLFQMTSAAWIMECSEHFLTNYIVFFLNFSQDSDLKFVPSEASSFFQGQQWWARYAGAERSLVFLVRCWAKGNPRETNRLFGAGASPNKAPLRNPKFTVTEMAYYCKWINETPGIADGWIHTDVIIDCR